MGRLSWRKLFLRALTIVLLAPVVVTVIFFDRPPYGSLPFLVFVISIAVMSLNEYFHMAYHENEPFFLTGHFLAITLILCAFIRESAPIWNSTAALVFSFVLIGFFLLELALKRMLFFRNKLFVTLKGIFYIGWFYSFFILIRNLPIGKELIFYVLFTIWALDIVAYLVGMTLGRHKLSPEISPKKTQEGAIGGFLAAVIMSYCLSSHYIGATHSLILGAIIGILGQCGDLYESLIKRVYGAKDSSNILPGHGGILDRADSFILLGPVVYYYILFCKW